jgi:hypothetical protein
VKARRLDAEVGVVRRHAFKDLLFLDTCSVLVWARSTLVSAEFGPTQRFLGRFRKRKRAW